MIETSFDPQRCRATAGGKQCQLARGHDREHENITEDMQLLWTDEIDELERR